MCTRFVCRGENMIIGFNFDIDPAVWNHKIIKEKDRFFIGILRPDGVRHSYHGVNRNGNVGTLLYVHGNPAGAYQDSEDCVTIADLTERFIRADISFDDALCAAREKKIVYAPDATMQAVLSDRKGRTLILEPGIGWREDGGQYSLRPITPCWRRSAQKCSLCRAMTGTRGPANCWTHMGDGLRLPMPGLCFGRSGRRESGRPEFRLFTRQGTTQCIMCRTIIFRRSSGTSFRSFEGGENHASGERVSPRK